jgi:hypothetical protein
MKIFTILTVLAVLACPVFAGTITDLGLFNTGTALTGTDANWQVGASQATIVTAGVPSGSPGWLANSGSVSRWISTTDNVGGMSALSDVVYDFTTTFTGDASKYVLSTVVIEGRWAADDYGSAFLGAAAITSTPALTWDGGSGISFSQWHTFTINGIAEGLNTLKFSVTNRGNTASENPAGLRFEVTSVMGDSAVSAVPEPGSLALLGGGLLALGFFRRRR